MTPVDLEFLVFQQHIAMEGVTIRPKYDIFLGIVQKSLPFGGQGEKIKQNGTKERRAYLTDETSSNFIKQRIIFETNKKWF